jgi:hypothetical protein
MSSQQSRKKDVHFQMPPRASRQARDDEVSVMEYFTRHIEACRSCDYESFVASWPIQTTSLCTAGHAYAVDVTKYMFQSRKVVYSSWEKSYGRLPIRLEISPRFKLVSRLLEAVEFGLCLQRTASNGSRGSSYIESKHASSWTQSPQIWQQPAPNLESNGHWQAWQPSASMSHRTQYDRPESARYGYRATSFGYTPRDEAAKTSTLQAWHEGKGEGWSLGDAPNRTVRPSVVIQKPETVHIHLSRGSKLVL